MPDFHIYIGYRTTSTWSLRGWLPMKKTGVPFEETLIRYRTGEGKATLNRLSPTGKVPFLVHKRPDGGEVQRMGFHRDSRVSRRDCAGRQAVAGRRRRPGACPRHLGGDAFRLPGAARTSQHGAARTSPQP